MTQERLDISVVVCAYNEEQLLDASLESLAAQTLEAERWEFIVCDDGSTDATASIAERFLLALPEDKATGTLLSIEHVGLSAARNAGARHAKGDIVAYLDADAIARPTWLEELLDVFEEGADYVGGRIELLNRDSWVARFLQETRHHQIFGPKLFKEDLIGCNMAYRKEVLVAVGGFQENFVSRGDEISLRALIPKRYRYRPAPRASIEHQRPDSVRQAIRTEWFSAKNSSMVQRATGHPLSLPRVIAGWAEKVLIAIFPLLLSLAAVSMAPIKWITVLSGLALLRRLFGIELSRVMFVHTVGVYGSVRGLAAHVAYIYIPILLCSVGLPLGYWLNRDEDVQEPRVKSIRVVRQVHGGRSAAMD